MKQAGYREIEHTADRELEVWGSNLPELLEYAAHGMYALSGTRVSGESIETRTIKLQAPDPESIIVSFLSELLYILETENLVFEEFDIETAQGDVSAKLTGRSLASLDKEIKAVTYHNLEIRNSSKGLIVNIVFDV